MHIRNLEIDVDGILTRGKLHLSVIDQDHIRGVKPASIKVFQIGAGQVDLGGSIEYKAVKPVVKSHGCDDSCSKTQLICKVKTLMERIVIGEVHGVIADPITRTDGNGVDAFRLDEQLHGLRLIVGGKFIPGSLHFAVDADGSGSGRRPGDGHLQCLEAADGRPGHAGQHHIVWPHQLHKVVVLHLRIVVFDSHRVGCHFSHGGREVASDAHRFHISRQMRVQMQHEVWHPVVQLSGSGRRRVNVKPILMHLCVGFRVSIPLTGQGAGSIVGFHGYD